MKRNLLLLISSLSFLILFSACTLQPNGGIFRYTINTNVQDTQIWCGTSRTNLSYCYSAPYSKYSRTSLHWSNKFFQARKAGYNDSAIIQSPYLANYAPANLSFHLVKGNSSSAVSNMQINNSEISGTALATAAIKLENTKKFIADGNLNRRDSVRNSVLHFAVLYGNLDSVKYILQNGGDIESKNNVNQTPLFYAAQYGKPEVAKFLISSGANRNVKDITGANPQAKANTMRDYWLKNRSNPAANQQIQDYNNVIAVLNNQNITVTKIVSKTKVNGAELDAYNRAKKDNTIMAYERFNASYPNSQYSESITLLTKKKRDEINANPQKQKEIFDKILAFLKKKDVDGLLKYANSNPEVLDFAHNHPKIYLLFTGPKELQVGKILQYKSHGLGDKILSAKIKNLNKPYRKFSLDEMEILIGLGLSENLIVAMIDVTTEYDKQNRQQESQQQLLKAQERIAQENKSTQTNVYQNQQTQQQPVEQGSSIGSKVMESVAEKAIEGLIRNLF